MLRRSRWKFSSTSSTSAIRRPVAVAAVETIGAVVMLGVAVGIVMIGAGGLVAAMIVADVTRHVVAAAKMIVVAATTATGAMLPVVAVMMTGAMIAAQHQQTIAGPQRVQTTDVPPPISTTRYRSDPVTN